MEADRHPTQPRPGEDKAGTARRVETELSEDGMSKFTKEWIDETRKLLKKETIINKKLVYEMLDEIERLSQMLLDIKDEAFNSEDAGGTMLWLQELFSEVKL